MPEDISGAAADHPEQQVDVDMVPIIERVAGTMVGAAAEADLESVPEAEKPLNLDERRLEILQTYPEMHPYRPAERTPTTIVRKFYGLSKNRPSIVAWRGIDVLLSRGDGNFGRQLEVIRGELDAAYAASVPSWRRMKRVRVGATMPGEAEWSHTAMLRAALPAFADRLGKAPVSDESATLAYKSLVKDVMPFMQDAGILSEVIAAALLARHGGRSFAFPAGLREESTNFRNDDDQLFNHDLYQFALPDLTKLPIQIKTRQSLNDAAAYDPGIVQVPLLDWLAPVILGRPGMTVTDSSRFLEYVRTVFVIPTPSGQAILDVAAKYLHDKIHEQAAEQGIGVA